MKTTFLLVGGLLCVSAWQANAADVGVNAAGTPDTVANSQGSELSTGTTMSGGPAISHEKTRAEVYQDLIQSQRSGEAARLHELFKGGGQ
jgi:parvulin-like peptidyl-prolyl isomerase